MTHPDTHKQGSYRCVKQMKHPIPTTQNYSWAIHKHLYNYLGGKVGPRGNFPQTAVTTQRNVTCHLWGHMLHSTAQRKGRGRQRHCTSCETAKH
jgi:hypothetical protein